MHFFRSKCFDACKALFLAVCGVLLLGCVAGLVPFNAHAQSGTAAQVSMFKLERSSDGIFVSAQIDFDLPQAVEDALQKGIPVFFVAQSELVQERWYWYNRSVAVVQRSMRLSYQPLTRRWRLNVSQGAPSDMNLSQTINQNFDTLDDALSAVRRFSRWRIADASPSDSDARMDMVFSFRLDLDKLPRPFQIGNFGQAEWMIAASAKGTVPVEISK